MAYASAAEDGALLGGLTGFGLAGAGRAVGSVRGGLVRRLGDWSTTARQALNLDPTPSAGGEHGPISAVDSRFVSSETFGLSASPLMKRWARHSLETQVRDLNALGDLATPHSFRNGMLLTQDVGQTAAVGRTWFRTYLEASIWIGWVNDVKPSNMGANGRAFDPSLDAVDKALLYGGGAVVGAGGFAAGAMSRRGPRAR